VATDQVVRQLDLALRALAIGDRPFVQRLLAACDEFGLLVADDVPEVHQPQFRAIEREAMAQGRVEATLAAMSGAEREDLATKLYEFAINVLRDHR
jgi:hypothetical protein